MNLYVLYILNGYRFSNCRKSIYQYYVFLMHSFCQISNTTYYRKPTICTDMVLPQDIAQLLPPFAMLFDFCECFHTFHHHRKPVLMNVFSEITLPTFLQAFYILTSPIFYNTARYFGQLVSRSVIFQIIVGTRHQIIFELCCI